ncbi:glycine-rich cell wall structural protein 1.8-like [Panicum virgatum]|uniref:glycine-rich cell wall structural protein 1.8-like n=1 Tax=Panicum virgatum TaxID=38727 RepID=UPI0019D67608|nr:glycine-rich cell wall structural protein 1.8-like [Panicum virgatum]
MVKVAGVRWAARRQLLGPEWGLVGRGAAQLRGVAALLGEEVAPLAGTSGGGGGGGHAQARPAQAEAGGRALRGSPVGQGHCSGCGAAVRWGRAVGAVGRWRERGGAVQLTQGSGAEAGWTAPGTRAGAGVSGAVGLPGGRVDWGRPGAERRRGGGPRRASRAGAWHAGTPVWQTRRPGPAGPARRQGGGEGATVGRRRQGVAPEAGEWGGGRGGCGGWEGGGKGGAGGWEAVPAARAQRGGGKHQLAARG